MAHFSIVRSMQEMRETFSLNSKVIFLLPWLQNDVSLWGATIERTLACTSGTVNTENYAQMWALFTPYENIRTNPKNIHRVPWYYFKFASVEIKEWRKPPQAKSWILPVFFNHSSFHDNYSLSKCHPRLAQATLLLASQNVTRRIYECRHQVISYLGINYMLHDTSRIDSCTK